MNKFKKLFSYPIVFFLLTATSFAFEHIESKVNFVEYEPKVIQNNLHKKKPFFLLFSAEWCHWCHIFNEKTLTDEEVYTYLNENFVSVFIDADINGVAYKQYKAQGVPYTVFLNPDSSIYFKYSGTLYAEQFLEVIRDVNQSIKRGISLNQEEKEVFEYDAPIKFSKKTIVNFREAFIEGVIDNFDQKEYGIGKREKTILPETFNYLFKTTKAKDRSDSIYFISATLKKAIDKIYDPIEGGFFRYAETADWEVPHFEKIANLNAGNVLLLYKVNQVKPDPILKKAADHTLKYLSKTLYDSKIGSFLSFQQADTSYYYLKKHRRENVEQPLVIDKIFTDNLAATLIYLLEVLDIIKNRSLEKKVLSSTDFLADMILNNESLFRYYSIQKKDWYGESGLSDYALLAKLFQQAFTKYRFERYQKAASKVLRISLKQYYDSEKNIFIDPQLDAKDYEYLMGINADFALAIMAESKNNLGKINKMVEPMIGYFSGLEELLEERIWDGKDWDLLERYALFLSAAETYLDFKMNQQN
tara:strand:- start:651 stop:2240 length:1590 start_codon:yes stop_codon:yes gene_type:complete